MRSISLHRLSLDYFRALCSALDSHMLNMFCNNIPCNIILCYNFYAHILDSHLWRCSASPSLDASAVLALVFWIAIDTHLDFSCNSLALATSNGLPPCCIVTHHVFHHILLHRSHCFRQQLVDLSGEHALSEDLEDFRHLHLSCALRSPIILTSSFFRLFPCTALCTG